jgi:hypothetical protein
MRAARSRRLSGDGVITELDFRAANGRRGFRISHAPALNLVHCEFGAAIVTKLKAAVHSRNAGSGS